MADIPATLTGLGALLVAVLGAVGPAAAAAPIITAPASLVAPVGSATVISGASVAGFGARPLRLVVTVTSGVLELPATTLDVTVPTGYPELGTTGQQLAIEGDESAVNLALADLSWVPAVPGAAEVTLDVSPAGAAYEPEGAHFYQLATAPAPISWTTARDAAASMTFDELAGSLAHVTTDAEQALLARIAPVDAWVGGADAGAPTGVRWLTAADQAASVTNFIVEYSDPSAESGPIAGRAIGGLRAAVPPAAPAIHGVSAGVGEATVHWQQPVADSGAPVLGYVVTGDPGGWCAVPATQLSCVLRGLVGGAAHTFRVAAMNETGLGAWSEPSASVVPAGEVAPVVPSAEVASVVPTIDPVDTTVQPVPNEAPVVDPFADAAAPAEQDVEDTEDPSIDGVAGAPTETAAPASQPASHAPSTASAAAAVGAAATAGTASASAIEPPATESSTSTAPVAVPSVPAAEAPADDTATVRAGSPALTIVFDVGPGASLTDAQFTVRGKHLSPGTVVTVVAHSEPVLIGTVDVGADGTLTWVGELPADLADGDHTLVAQGVGHDGSKVERTTAFTAEAGRLVRIGASSTATLAPTVSAAATAAPAADAAAVEVPSSPSESTRGGVPRRALAVVALLGVLGLLWWRDRSRRSAASAAATTEHTPAGDGAASPRSARTTTSPAGGSSGSRKLATSGARRRSRRQPARSI